MARRSGCGTTPAASDKVGSWGGPTNSREAKKGQSIPTRARPLAGNGAQRTVAATRILETIDEHLDGDGVAPILSFQQRAGPRNAPVEAPRGAGHPRSSSVVAIQEPPRRQPPHIGFIDNFLSTLSRRFAEPTLR